MKPIAYNESFVCAHCTRLVPKATQGYRNHCPFCLHSLHVDGDITGDRTALCHGLMKPIGCVYNSQKSLQLVQECGKCHKLHRNILAPDDCMDLIPALIAQENARVSASTGRKRIK